MSKELFTFGFTFFCLGFVVRFRRMLERLWVEVLDLLRFLYPGFSELLMLFGAALILLAFYLEVYVYE